MVITYSSDLNYMNLVFFPHCDYHGNTDCLFYRFAFANDVLKHGWIQKREVFLKGISMLAIFSGLDGKKLLQVWNIACHFYLFFLRFAVNSTFDRKFLCVHCKNHISYGRSIWMLYSYPYQLYFNNLLTTALAVIYCVLKQ